MSSPHSGEARSATPSNPILRLISVLFFLSGASALIYEVVWMRQLTQIFGNTAHAAATVLTAFMAGLSLGSFLFGRLSDRLRATVVSYGLLEIGIGIYGLLFPRLLVLLPGLYRALFPVMEESLLRYTLILFLVTFLFVLVPTTLMGATLPVLSRTLVRRLEEVGERVGRLYAFNTFGAVTGCLLAGFVLMEVLGLSGSIRAAALLNLVVGGAILLLSRAAFFREAPAPENVGEETASAAGAIAAGGWGRAAVLVGIGLSGAASLVYEHAWTRMLALILGSSTYAFTLMLAAFLVGLAWGSYYYGRRFGSRPATWGAFGWIEAAIALSVLAMIPLYERFPFVLITLTSFTGFFFPWVSLVQITIAFAVMAVPTFLLGMTFPLAVRLYTRDTLHVGTYVGTVYAGNTLGAILGAFVGGFLLIPLLGIQAAFLVGAGLNAAVAAMAMLLDPGRAPAARALRAGGVAAGLAGLIFSSHPWDPRVLLSGATVYLPIYARLPNDRLRLLNMKRHEVLFHRDGLSATISVHQNPQHLFLRTNGKTDASDGDALTQLMVGYLPMLHKPDARTVALVGMGSGMTAHAVSRFPVDRIEVIEIEAAVIEAARLFGAWNGRIHDDPRVRFIAADGRNYLTAVPRRYDVIISEPSNPWIAGIANLYTREFYLQAREKLNPDGVFCQWVQNYAISPDDLRMVLRTFSDAFPHSSLWQAKRGDYLLLGSMRPLPRDGRIVRETFRRYPAVAAELALADLPTSQALLSLHRLDRKGVLAFSDGARVNTDDRPRLEFSAPRSLFWDTNALNQALLAEHENADGGSCETDYQGYRGARAGGDWARALKSADRAVACDETDARFRLARAEALGWLRRFPEAREELEEALARKGPGVTPERISEYAAMLPAPERLRIGRAVIRRFPDSPQGLLLLAEARLDRGRPGEAYPLIEKAREKTGPTRRTALLLSRVLVGLERLEEAERSLAAAREMGEQGAQWFAVRGEIDRRRGEYRKAAAAFREAFRRSSMNAVYLVREGVCLAEAGALDEARRSLGDAVLMEPDNLAAWKEFYALERRIEAGRG